MYLTQQNIVTIGFCQAWNVFTIQQFATHMCQLASTPAATANSAVNVNICSLGLNETRGSAIAEEPRDALRQFKYYGRFLTELLTRSSANPEEPCEHNVS